MSLTEIGPVHCFRCHENHHPKEIHLRCLSMLTRDCDEKCDPKWQEAWDKLKSEMPLIK